MQMTPNVSALGSSGIYCSKVYHFMLKLIKDILLILLLKPLSHSGRDSLITLCIGFAPGVHIHTAASRVSHVQGYAVKLGKERKRSPVLFRNAGI